MSNEPKNETELNRLILALGCGPTRLFRNNIGQAWQGESTQFNRRVTVSVDIGDVLVRRAMPVKYGVCNPGGSDMIGWHVVTITPEMVGCHLPVFVGIEGKFGRNKPTDPQINFTAAIRNSGGIGVVAYSVDAARAALDGWRPMRK